MNVFQIKVIAIILMVIDHIGVFFFPDMPILRVIGRLSFPLFAWLIANGAFYTKNIYKYAIRLLIFALVSQYFYMSAFRLVIPEHQSLNILFTLFLGLLCIIILKSVRYKYVGYLLTGVISVLAGVFNVNYGAYGVLSIVFFYQFFHDFPVNVLIQSLLILIFYSGPIYWEAFGPIPASNLTLISIFQPAALLSLIFIKEYSGKKGRSEQYLFYAFYPLHFFVITLIKLFL